ncbi:hypothetical protein RclHR1_01230006 [Rhizophagus clarus]|uniref:Uncharacterized protein n=1 Tax=Rhizophagus clarus TaxID=94130 RepID=A0A2Z6Q6T9_9GLOM|nr:hypothetical protein RclHR1_01230006 [Rhizophagus clarus]GES99335.1 hypothetical protein GLOIN_2v1470083 [Rhizophagus clarus]
MSITLNLDSLFTETVTDNFNFDTGSVTEFDAEAEFYTEEAITKEITELVNQAKKFGFNREKFLDWMSSISKEFLLTQTLEYWLLTYVSQTAIGSTDSWNEDYSPGAWLVECFSLKTADFIVNGVSEEYLKAQTPKYWINWAIYQFTNQASEEFTSFIENASESKVHVFKNTPIIVTTVNKTSNQGNELNFLLETDQNQFNDKTTWYYHTTDLISTESILTNGICMVGQIKQDFGGRSPSFYLNDEFKWAIDFGLQKFISSPSAIIIYDIPKILLKGKDYCHLDLSGNDKKWMNVMRKSRNFCECEADDYDSIYGPQATNYIRMIRNKHETPKEAINKNQLALKYLKLTRLIDSRIDAEMFKQIVVDAEAREVGYNSKHNNKM